MPRAHLDDKFVRIHKFVTEKTNRDKTNTGTFLIEDDDILSFWQQNSNYEEFKVYRSVFDNFVVYMKAYVETGLARNFFNPSIIGANREENEVEPQSTEGKLGGGESWESPLHIFDEKPTSEVKFFKQKNERAPIEQLMKYGPFANSLPIAFLRTETFGAVQSGITNDLQIMSFH